MQLQNQTPLQFQTIHPSLAKKFELCVLEAYCELSRYSRDLGKNLPEFNCHIFYLENTLVFREASSYLEESYAIEHFGVSDIDELSDEEWKKVVQEVSKNLSDCDEDFLNDILRVFGFYNLFYLPITRAGIYGTHLYVEFVNSPLQEVW